MTSVTSFISNYAIKKGHPFTHTTMISPRRSFYMKDEKVLNKFWILYCNNIIKGDEIVGINECASTYGPLRIDFDFKFPVDIGLKRKYTKKHVEDIIHVYQNILANMIEPSDYDDKMLFCILLEKSKPRIDEGYVKDGFHLHFPHFICDSYIQNVFIRGKIIEKLETDPMFVDFREKVAKNVVDSSSDKLSMPQQIDKIVDQVATKPWLLYGSRKAEHLEAWSVTNCYDESLDTITLNKMFEDQLSQLHGNKEKKNSVRYYLPKLLSIHNHETPTPITDTVQEELDKRQNLMKLRKKAAIKQVRSMEESYADLQVIEQGKLMDMISDRRADDYDEWMNIGWTLFNIGQGCDKALDMWIDFSKRSEKFKEGACEEAWDKMEMKGKTIGSLKQIAKTDDPDAYNEWKGDQLDKLLYDAVQTPKPTHYGIAKVMHKMYEHRFVCADSQHDIWYEFYNHRWHRVDNGISILKLMPTDVSNKFLDFINKLTFKIQNNDWEKEKNEKRRDRAYKILTELGQAPFCGQVLKMCKTLFYNSDLLKNMDENRDILGFENGVYDLKQGMFRDGSPDDYITYSTGRNYFKYSYQDEEIIDLMDYLTKVFVNPKLRYYFLDFTCSCLQGGNRNKTFSVFTGEGDAGKSVIIKLLMMVFGDYAINFPRETFVMGRGSSAGGARPDLARVRGKRIAFVKEIAKNEKLHIGMVKEMTGNDSFFARNLFEKGTDINPMFTLVLMCNEPPQIPAHDEPTWNRIRVLPFESTFPKPNDKKRKVPDSFEEQMRKKIFPQDPHLEDRLAEFAAPLTWLLLERFKTYYKSGLIEPKEVQMSTHSYKVNNDVYMQFIQERIEKTEDKKDFIRLQEAFSDFKSWYIENHPSYAKEKIGKGTFKVEMNKRLEPVDKNSRWCGYKFIVDADEDVEVSQNDLTEDEHATFELD